MAEAPLQRNTQPRSCQESPDQSRDQKKAATGGIYPDAAPSFSKDGTFRVTGTLPLLA
jgi:hypothetical protein